MPLGLIEGFDYGVDEYYEQNIIRSSLRWFFKAILPKNRKNYHFWEFFVWAPLISSGPLK